MSIDWDGADKDRQAAIRAGEERAALLETKVGETIMVANEFADMRISRVETRNGTRLLIDAPRSGQWIALDPMELEALTWQTPTTFSAMIARPDAPMFAEDEFAAAVTVTEGQEEGASDASHR